MKWTDAETQLLIEHYPNMPMPELTALLGMTNYRIYNKTYAMGLKRSEEYLASPAACRLRREATETSIANRFKPGQKAWNKGMKGWSPAGTEATRFKPGTKPPNHRPIGTIRIVDGYQEVKMAEGIRQWKQLHRVIWERLNGVIPKGMNLIFRDGNRLNTSIINLELMTKKQNMQRNSYHNNYPKEIQLAIQLRGALNRQINKRINHEQH